jgi:hypothetical protein
MCTVSMIMDDWRDRFNPPGCVPNTTGGSPTYTFWPPAGPTKEEFDALKAEVQRMKKLLIAAKIYDEESGQPDCENADKIALFRQLAKLLGVDIEDLFPEKA